MADFNFEGNTFRGVIDYLNSTGMESRYVGGEFVYSTKSGKIVVHGQEGKEDRVETSGGIEGGVLLNLSRVTGDTTFLDKRRDTLREIAHAMPEDRKAARGILISQARAANHFDTGRPIRGKKKIR